VTHKNGTVNRYTTTCAITAILSCALPAPSFSETAVVYLADQLLKMLANWLETRPWPLSRQGHRFKWSRRSSHGALGSEGFLRDGVEAKNTRTRVPLVVGSTTTSNPALVGATSGRRGYGASNLGPPGEPAIPSSVSDRCGVWNTVCHQRIGDCAETQPFIFLKGAGYAKAMTLTAAAPLG